MDKPGESGQTQEIEIHDYDTWSMDDTLAPIILPMLKQLKATKNGSPMVDKDDVPLGMGMSEEAKAKLSETGEPDAQYHARWDWVLDEMIWAFEEKCKDDWQDQFYGGYIEDEKCEPLGGRFEWINHDGMIKHQKRMSNGFRLFGKYYENLWD